MATSSLKKPKKTCDDKNCPFHGRLSIRGRVQLSSALEWIKPPLCDATIFIMYQN